MEDRIFDNVVSNPNARALVIPLQEGGTADDNYFGSIGDATTKHVSSLPHGDRQLWEGLFHAKNGMIFRIEPSTTIFDKDPMNLRGEDLGEWLKRWMTIPIEYDTEGKLVKSRKPTPSEVAVFQEAVEVEQEHRLQSEDAYDHSDTLPYSQLEQYPGMEKHIDMPKTPRDMMIYMGNSTQIFYDHFPEGHPDEKIINIALQKLNKSWDDLTEDYSEWFRKWIHDELVERYVAKVLSKLCDVLAEGKKPPIDATKAALDTIDHIWQKQWHKKAKHRYESDPIYAMLKKNQELWRVEAKQGKSLYTKIKSFGQVLWKNYRDQMKAHHWNLYRKTRNEHAPRVNLRGMDINRCSMQQLRELFKAESGNSDSFARKVWTKRPFPSLVEVRNLGCITRKTFSEDDRSEKVMKGLEEALERSKKQLNPGIFNVYRGKMIDAQRCRAGGLSNWSPIWAYYHLLKKELDQHLAEAKQEVPDGREGQNEQQKAA